MAYRKVKMLLVLILKTLERELSDTPPKDPQTLKQ
jgi:hypothetical protein